MTDVAVNESEKLVESVRERYGKIAKEGSGCCAPSCCGGAEETKEHTTVSAPRLGYKAEDLDAVPAEADLGLGCGAPVEALGLTPGETVLDLGAGGGLDAFLAARQVGPSGKVYGVDMTPEMVERARRNAREGGYENVDFRQGRLESLPLGDGSIDAITSNCVINLVPDKAAVFREAFRVLKPGGRLVISDIVLDGQLPEAVEKSVMAYVGCVAGAMQRESYFAAVRDAGLIRVEVLKDIDFLDKMGGELPPDAQGVLDEVGVSVDALRGKVRSVTFRASKARG